MPEPDKSKGRFSSKYRGPVDRPLYQPTVPSVTPSTVSVIFILSNYNKTISF